MQIVAPGLTAGNVCDIKNPEKTCDRLANGMIFPGKGYSAKPICLYNEKLQENALSNINFSGGQEYTRFGRCSYPVNSIGQSCNNIVGCSGTAICIQLTDTQETSYCLHKFDTLFCINEGDCSEGYSCVK